MDSFQQKKNQTKHKKVIKNKYKFAPVGFILFIYLFIHFFSVFECVYFSLEKRIKANERRIKRAKQAKTNDISMHLDTTHEQYHCQMRNEQSENVSKISAQQTEPTQSQPGMFCRVRESGGYKKPKKC